MNMCGPTIFFGLIHEKKITTITNRHPNFNLPTFSITSL